MNNTAYELIGCGKCGNVFSDGNIAMKRYFDECYIYRIKEEVFNKLKEVNNPCFVNFMDLIKVKRRGKEIVDGYTYKYIEEVGDYMIDLPMEYTYETLHQFQKLLEQFNELKVFVDDAYEDNLVLSKDGLVIIDPDIYSIYKGEDLNELRKHNKEFLLYYLIDLWEDEYYRKYNLERTNNNVKKFGLVEKLVLGNDELNIETNLRQRLNYKNPDELINNLVRKRSL